MAEPNKQDKVYFEYLDVVRFFAAFMIIFLHAYDAWCGWYGEVGFFTGGTYKDFTTFGKYVNQFIENLGLGVDIFFLISGFLITYILIVEKKRYGKIQIGKFMIRRSLRIWPLYFLLIIIAPLLVHLVEAAQPNYLANIFFVGNFETIYSQTWTFPFAHFWSICIEEHFYLVWPFVILFVPFKKLLPTFLTIIALSIAFRLFAFSSMHHPWYTLFLHTLSRIDVLVLGAIGAYFYAKKPFQFKLKRSFKFLLFAVLLVSLCVAPVYSWDNLFLAGFKKYFYIGIIALLLLDYNFNPSFKRLLPKKSIIHYFGKISYGIYMYGNIVQFIIIKQILWQYKISNMWIFFLLVVAMSIIIPIISYELIEKQILKLNKRFKVVKTER